MEGISEDCCVLNGSLKKVINRDLFVNSKSDRTKTETDGKETLHTRDRKAKHKVSGGKVRTSELLWLRTRVLDLGWRHFSWSEHWALLCDVFGRKSRGNSVLYL